MKPQPTPDILGDLLGPAPIRPQTIELNRLRLDGGTQMRARLDDNTVREYAAAMSSGWGQFPPIIVYYDGADHWLGDGFHRVAAARDAGITTAPADIRAGHRRDAILHAAGANASHGLRRSQADKRRSVETLLRDDEWRDWSDREIARKCNVSADLVGAVRRELHPPPPPVTVVSDSEPAATATAPAPAPVVVERTFVTKHGTTAVMQTANIGKTQPAYAAVWAIERRVSGVLGRLNPGDPTAQHAADLRNAARTPGSALMREIEASLDEAGLEFRRQDLVAAMHNVASQIEQECRRQAAPTVAVPIKIAQPAPARTSIADLIKQIHACAPQFYTQPHEQVAAHQDIMACATTCSGGFWKFVTAQIADIPADDMRQAMQIVAGELAERQRLAYMAENGRRNEEHFAKLKADLEAAKPAAEQPTFAAWLRLTNGAACRCGSKLSVSGLYERKDAKGAITSSELDVYCTACGNEESWHGDANGWRMTDSNTVQQPAAVAVAVLDAAAAILTPDRIAEPPVSQRDGYDSDEWYTPEEIIRTAAGVMLRIDCDPASCELAQTVVQAGTYYTKFEDGLKQEWHGNIWLNPPYSCPQAWVDKLFAEIAAGRTKQAIVLVNNATETAWFQRLLSEAKLCCFPARRLAFWRHDHKDVGARQGQAIFYFGSRAEVFHGAFSATGAVLRRIK